MPTTADKTYTGCNHVSGPGFHLAIGNPSFLLRYRGQEWCVEWHYYFGPSIVHKRTGEPRRKQPGEKSMFWLVVQWWHDQGGVVKDGVGVWQEPPIVEKRFSRLSRGNLIADPDGDIVFRHYQGYEQFGIVRK